MKKLRGGTRNQLSTRERQPETQERKKRGKTSSAQICRDTYDWLQTGKKFSTKITEGDGGKKNYVRSWEKRNEVLGTHSHQFQKKQGENKGGTHRSIGKTPARYPAANIEKTVPRIWVGETKHVREQRVGHGNEKLRILGQKKRGRRKQEERKDNAGRDLNKSNLSSIEAPTRSQAKRGSINYKGPAKAFTNSTTWQRTNKERVRENERNSVTLTSSLLDQHIGKQKEKIKNMFNVGRKEMGWNPVHCKGLIGGRTLAKKGEGSARQHRCQKGERKGCKTVCHSS